MLCRFGLKIISASQSTMRLTNLNDIKLETQYDQVHRANISSRRRQERRRNRTPPPSYEEVSSMLRRRESIGDERNRSASPVHRAPINQNVANNGNSVGGKAESRSSNSSSGLANANLDNNIPVTRGVNDVSMIDANSPPINENV